MPRDPWRLSKYVLWKLKGELKGALEAVEKWREKMQEAEEMMKRMERKNGAA